MAITDYDKIIERVFLQHHETDAHRVPFEREDLAEAARALGVTMPKNLGDIVYTYRYRRSLPTAILDCIPHAKSEWIIRGIGRAQYCFVAVSSGEIAPRDMMAVVKIPDSTPGLIARYALSDEQALLARVRYNRLIDVFSGITCYSLQNHLRTAVADLGQLETDEVYVGIDRAGVHYIIPVQAKGGTDRLSVVQIMQDFDMCRDKFPSLVCRPIAAQFLGADVIVLFSFRESGHEVEILEERHYRLVSPGQLSDDDVEAYRRSLPQ